MHDHPAPLQRFPPPGPPCHHFERNPHIDSDTVWLAVEPPRPAPPRQGAELVLIASLLKADKLKVAPIANPAMPVPVPNIFGMLPGMTFVATAMMNNWMKKAKVARLSELLEMAQEMGVRLIACQMSMDVMGVKKEALIDGVEIGGAATFLEFASENSVSLTF